MSSELQSESDGDVKNRGWIRGFVPSRGMANGEEVQQTTMSGATSAFTLATRAEARLASSLAAGHIRATDVGYLREYQLSLLQHTATLSDRDLEIMRALTASWDLSPRIRQHTSHRPVIGRFIVLAKRVLFPIIRAALKEELAQQRAFNGALIEYLARK
jgi:hypothetical protein